MCIYVDLSKHKDKKPFIAKEDIICYKVLEQFPDNTLRTPYMDKEVTIDVLSADYFQVVPNKNDTLHHIYDRFNAVNKGIHSFQKLNEAVDEKLMLSKLNVITGKIAKIVIKEAIIPKGTKYWIGMQGDYCSSKIILQKTIEKCV